MTFDPDMDITFREATDKDFGQVKELSKDIYHNTDTLVSDFVGWLKSSKWFQFVGETQKGRVIAFIAVELTDGRESLNIRSSRVDKNYRGRGIYKALFRYAIQCVRERFLDIRRIYRLRPAEVRIPDGYDIVKKRCLIKLFWNRDVETYNEEKDVNPWKVRFVTWPKFKELYESSEAVSKLFVGNCLEIHGDVFNLDCKANWAALENRVNVRIMMTECVDRDGRAESVISFLKLEQSFTNEGTQMVAVNIYGLNKAVVKCHIVKGVLEATRYVGGVSVLFSFFVEKDIIAECTTALKELFDSDVKFQVEFNLLIGDLSKNLEDIRD